MPRPRRGAVVAEHALAAEVGVEVLERGGNAADAAVAAALALAVVLPQAGNLGGGGFAVWVGYGGEARTLDFREAAPAAARPELYLDGPGLVAAERAREGVLSRGRARDPRGALRAARQARLGALHLRGPGRARDRPGARRLPGRCAPGRDARRADRARAALRERGRARALLPRRRAARGGRPARAGGAGADARALRAARAGRVRRRPDGPGPGGRARHPGAPRRPQRPGRPEPRRHTAAAGSRSRTSRPTGRSGASRCAGGSAATR